MESKGVGWTKRSIWDNHRTTSNETSKSAANFSPDERQRCPPGVGLGAVPVQQKVFRWLSARKPTGHLQYNIYDRIFRKCKCDTVKQLLSLQSMFNSQSEMFVLVRSWGCLSCGVCVCVWKMTSRIGKQAGLASSGKRTG